MNDIDYQQYKKIIENAKIKDQREFYIQRRLIEPFISSIVPELHVEDVSIYRSRKSSKNHCFNQYAGVDGNNKVVRLPDLLIVEEWNYFNTNEINKLKCKAVVEVKTPFPKDGIYREINNDHRLYPYEYESYIEETKQSISLYLNASENNRVILTDGLQWDFFHTKDKPIKRIKLVKLKTEEKTTQNKPERITHGEWIEPDEKYKELSDYITEFLK